MGTTIRLNDEPYTIVGVLPRRFPLQVRSRGTVLLLAPDVVVPLAPERDPLRRARTELVARISLVNASNARRSRFEARRWGGMVGVGI